MKKLIIIACLSLFMVACESGDEKEKKETMQIEQTVKETMPDVVSFKPIKITLKTPTEYDDTTVFYMAEEAMNRLMMGQIIIDNARQDSNLANIEVAENNIAVAREIEKYIRNSNLEVPYGWIAEQEASVELQDGTTIPSETFVFFLTEDMSKAMYIGVKNYYDGIISFIKGCKNDAPIDEEIDGMYGNDSYPLLIEDEQNEEVMEN